MEQKSKYMVIYTFYDNSIEVLYFDTLKEVIEYIDLTEKILNEVERKQKTKVYEIDDTFAYGMKYKNTRIGQATKAELDELRKENSKDEIVGC